jgi:phosphohistidine phosphatase SixA
MGKAMQRRRLIALASGATLLACAPEAPADPQTALRQGGHVIYLRHARSTMQPEPAIQDLADCSWQRNLSEEGRAQASELGERVRSLGLPVGEVLSSAFCRARDTAQLVLGRHQLWEPLTYHSTQTAEQHAANVAAIRTRIGETPAGGRDLWLVSHQNGLRDAAGISLSEGEAAILQPLGDGEVRLLWRLWPAGLRPVGLTAL